jgi:hypothetical protein
MVRFHRDKSHEIGTPDNGSELYWPDKDGLGHRDTPLQVDRAKVDELIEPMTGIPEVDRMIALARVVMREHGAREVGESGRPQINIRAEDQS